MQDQFGRKIEYLRLSVADKCNLRCFYCLPKGFNDFEEPKNWLSFDEIERVVTAFGRLGVSRLRITGGEPLVRKNLSSLAGRLNAISSIEDLSLSTNASLLATQAEALFQSGIKRINVSLDTLRQNRFKEITGGDLSPVLKGLETAKSVGFKPIKINMVVMRDVNDDEIEDMLDYCIKNQFTLRLIETMPMGATGRDAVNHYVDLTQVKKQLEKKYSLIPGVMPGGGPARYMQVQGTDVCIGFITPISQHFCETCNRVRLAVDGTLYMCLGQDHKFELRPLLRQGISDSGLDDAIREAINLKPERHEFNEKPGQVVRFMSMTGG